MSTLTEMSAEIRGALKKVARSRGNNTIRLNFGYYFAKNFIDSIGSHFPYVNVDIRGVIANVNACQLEGVGGKKEDNYLEIAKQPDFS